MIHRFTQGKWSFASYPGYTRVRYEISFGSLVLEIGSGTTEQMIRNQLGEVDGDDLTAVFNHAKEHIA